jgi:hypothetical protein
VLISTSNIKELKMKTLKIALIAVITPIVAPAVVLLTIKDKLMS